MKQILIFVCAFLFLTVWFCQQSEANHRRENRQHRRRAVAGAVANTGRGAARAVGETVRTVLPPYGDSKGGNSRGGRCRGGSCSR